jgi:hypothetical protein
MPSPVSLKKKATIFEQLYDSKKTKESIVSRLCFHLPTTTNLTPLGQCYSLTFLTTNWHWQAYDCSKWSTRPCWRNILSQNRGQIPPMGSWVTILRVRSAQIQNHTNWKHSHCTSHQSRMHQRPTLLLGDFPWEFLRWVSICFWCCIIFQVQSQCLHPTKPHMNEVEDEAKSLNMRLMLFPYNLWWIYIYKIAEKSPWQQFKSDMTLTV